MKLERWINHKIHKNPKEKTSESKSKIEFNNTNKKQTRLEYQLRLDVPYNCNLMLMISNIKYILTKFWLIN